MTWNLFTYASTLCAVGVVWYTIQYCKPTVDKNTSDKLILTWVPFFGQDSFYGFGGGDNKAFQAAGCAVTTCKIIDDHTSHRPEIYDAILFHGFEYYTVFFGYPNTRNPNQLYVYLTWEPQHHSEIPHFYTEFYNMTITYRLDSDIVWPYYLIVDRRSEEVVAPSLNPSWDLSLTNEISEVEEIKALVSEKQRVAAWVVSNCNSDSNREQYVNELRRHGINTDVYGRCGTFTCVRNEREDCTRTIAHKYYFYLVFENSYCVDYVTEKLVIAMLGGAVPVVLNGANLTRFLPPGSYLDARKLGPKALAAKMKELINNLHTYEQFFWWRSRYRIQRNEPDLWTGGNHPFCKLCAILHSKQPFKTSRDKTEVRNWWHTMPDSENPACFYRDWGNDDLVY